MVSYHCSEHAHPNRGQNWKSEEKLLERVFDIFLKYHMNILLGDFNATVSREDFLN
jgi:hypothetical protein